MRRTFYVYILFLYFVFFSFSLKINAASYIIKKDENDRNRYCTQNKEEVSFNCGEYKKIESCHQVKIEVCNKEPCSSTTYDGDVYISTYIFIYEVGYFDFGHISSVYAGKGFNFPDVSYKRTVYWEFYRDWEKIVLLEAKKNFNRASLNESEINSYSTKLKKAASNAFKAYLNNNYGENYFNNNIHVEADDSNVYNSKGNLVEVMGNWKSSNNVTYEVGENENVTQEFVYNFCDAYVNLTGSKFSDVEYKCNNSYLGEGYSAGYKKYFVPFLYPDGKTFRFNVVNEKDSSYLNINGTCNINVVNELFDYDDGQVEPRYYYRPISLSNPFPDNKVAANWKKYDDNDNLLYLSRLRNSYKNGFYYKVILSNGDSNNGEVSIDNIENRNYNDWTNIDANGKSKFLEKFNTNNDNSYCEIGKFNKDCDFYREYLGSDS